VRYECAADGIQVRSERACWVSERSGTGEGRSGKEGQSRSNGKQAGGNSPVQGIADRDHPAYRLSLAP